MGDHVWSWGLGGALFLSCGESSQPVGLKEVGAWACVTAHGSHPGRGLFWAKVKASRAVGITRPGKRTIARSVQARSKPIATMQQLQNVHWMDPSGSAGSYLIGCTVSRLQVAAYARLGLCAYASSYARVVPGYDQQAHFQGDKACQQTRSHRKLRQGLLFAEVCSHSRVSSAARISITCDSSLTAAHRRVPKTLRSACPASARRAHGSSNKGSDKQGSVQRLRTA